MGKPKVIATCAKCGIRTDLCDSGRVDGIKEPRVCKACLLAGLQTGDFKVDSENWIRQLIETGELESVSLLVERSK